jgi:hypothetical protein
MYALLLDPTSSRVSSSHLFAVVLTVVHLAGRSGAPDPRKYHSPLAAPLSLSLFLHSVMLTLSFL